MLKSIWWLHCITNLEQAEKNNKSQQDKPIPDQRCSVRLYLQLFEGGLMSCLHYLVLITYSGVQHILCCVFVLFVFVLCTLCCQFLWIIHFLLCLWYSLTFYIFVSHMVANKCITYNKQHTDWNLWKCYLTEMSTCNIHVFWPWHIFGSHWSQFLYTCLTVYSGEPKHNKIQSLYTYRNHLSIAIYN